MLISGLLDEDGREIRYSFGFGKGHIGKDGLDTESSSHGLELTEELRRQTVATSRV